MSTKPKAGSMVRLGEPIKLVVATNQKESEPQVTAPGSAEPPSGTVTVEQTQTVQVGPAGPVKTVVTAKDPEIAGALGVPTTTGSQSQTQQPQPQQLQGATGTAKIRYQVPPITKPMGLKIEMVDAAGTRNLLGRDVKGGEYITLDAPFVKESVVTIYLGGEFVWQERYR